MPTVRVFINAVLRDGTSVYSITDALTRAAPAFTLESVEDASPHAYVRGLLDIGGEDWREVAKLFAHTVTYPDPFDGFRVGPTQFRHLSVTLSSLTTPLVGQENDAARQAHLGSYEAFTCERCGIPYSFLDHGYRVTSHFGWLKPEDGGPDQIHCYACCADEDQRIMDAKGVHWLYASEDATEVTNWPASLRFAVTRRWHSATGLLRVTFADRHGQGWTGVQTSKHNELLKCKRSGRT